jgi:VanZ family protein
MTGIAPTWPHRRPEVLSRASPRLRLVALRLVQLAFVASVVISFTVSVTPGPEAPRGLPWDKANHFGAFFVMMGLGAAARPGKNPWLMALGLWLFGGLIEVVQSMPVVHRDGDVMDWLADTLGILAVLAPLMVRPWWDWLGRSPR